MFDNVSIDPMYAKVAIDLKSALDKLKAAYDNGPEKRDDVVLTSSEAVLIHRVISERLNR